MLGLKHNLLNGRVPILRGQREGKVGQNESEKDLELREGKVLPQAIPRPDSEGQEHVRLRARAADSVGEPLRVEFKSIGTPYLRVLVQLRYGHPSVEAFGNMNVAESQVL